MYKIQGNLCPIFLRVGLSFFSGGQRERERAKHSILGKSSLFNFPTILTSFP